VNKTTGHGMKNGHRLWVLVGLIVTASFAVRIGALAYWQTGSIENEGAEYARIAENLRNGVGYVGIAFPGAELLFNPLFPWLIAGTSFVTGNYEWAARFVSLVIGALLPLAGFGIASRLFDRRVGIVAAMLISAYPLLVNLSFTTFSEGAYATLLLSGVYIVLRALNCSSIRVWLLVGGVFGLAYLVRAEAVAPFLISALFALIATDAGRAVRCKRCLAAIGAFLVLALPEVIFIYRSTGRVLLDGKSTIFFAMGKRTLAAETNRQTDRQSAVGQPDAPSAMPNVESEETWQQKWANLSIDANLKRTGVVMRPNADVIRETRIIPKELARLVAMGVRNNAPVVPYRLSSAWLGAPFVPALALLGVLRRPWRRPQASARLYFVLVAAAPVVVTFTFLWSDTRHYFVLVPFLLILASNGLVEVGSWTTASSVNLGWHRVVGPVLSKCIIPGLIGLALIIYPIRAVRKLDAFREGALSNRVEKDLGVWIERQQERPVRIMDIPKTLAFHARAAYIQFPYCTGELALRFLDAAEVDYVILRQGRTFTQYYQEWLTRGIPDHRAELLDVSSVPNAGELVVFRWHRGGS
jgi:4-amino-4-deoxy-L-arabinose transferase-like glycosyltransferase